jgi:lipopolysaccharide export system permease protein
MGTSDMVVKGAYDRNLIHIEGDRANRQDKSVKPLRVTIPENLAGNLIHLTAREAHYIPERKGWEMTGTVPAELDTTGLNVLEMRDTGRYFLHVTEVDFDALTRNANWYTLASTLQLYQELQNPNSNRLTAMAVVFHCRMTRPLLGLLLVFLGLSVILRDTNRNMILSVGACLVICANFFMVCHSCKMLGEQELLSPSFAAWLPVLLFGPPALVMFDAVQT